MKTIKELKKEIRYKFASDNPIYNGEKYYHEWYKSIGLLEICANDSDERVSLIKARCIDEAIRFVLIRERGSRDHNERN